jgi:DNA-binding transcriptional LysR family regulator
MGIALVPMYMCEDEIKEGSLELLSEQVYEYRDSYYFVSPAGARPIKALDDFRDWLLDISKQHRDDDTAG